ncbi:MAG: PilZ domain-containing protein [Proteobacteria bacterium]|nr:PilZ domain-containing protein [Pseudomonadota bacterium]MBU1546182.1 PilZ domain-containing protein [Pseudomonadota bacterium]MBU2619460.1 PilZ domain-containing protein [Pseudomonadota bacterium]
MKNKRKNTRVPFQVVIGLDFPDQSHAECETADLSLKGVFVLGVTGHKLGENCLVSLRLLGSTSHLTLKMKGTVVRVEEDGLALHFYEMDLDSFFHLKNILYYNSEDPDVLDEELSTQIENFQDPQ